MLIVDTKRVEVIAEQLIDCLANFKNCGGEKIHPFNADRVAVRRQVLNALASLTNSAVEESGLVYLLGYGTAEFKQWPPKPVTFD